MLESGDVVETQHDGCRDARILWQELDCPKPNVQGSICPLIGNMSDTDALLNTIMYGRIVFFLQEGR